MNRARAGTLGGVTISGHAEVAALLLMLGVHIIGAGVLIWAMVSGDEHTGRPGWRDWWPRDDGGDEPPASPEPPRGGGDVLPGLPDAAPADVRRRGPGRLGDLTPRPARRPAHEPQREREPAG